MGKRKLPEGMRLRGKTYYAWFQVNKQRFRKKLSTNFKVACDKLAEMKLAAIRNEAGVQSVSMWEAAKADYLAKARQTAPRTFREYERDLATFESFYTPQRLTEVTEDLVLAYREHRLQQVVSRRVRKDNSEDEPQLDEESQAVTNDLAGKEDGRRITPRTVNKEVGTIKALLRLAVRRKRIPSSPLADLKPLAHDDLAKERRSLTSAEVLKLFAASPAYLKPVWRFIAATGCRRDEVAKLLWSDIDFDAGTAKVRRGSAKNHKVRVIPLRAEIVAMLVELRTASKKRCPTDSNYSWGDQARAKFSKDHVFVSKVNTPLGNNLLNRFYAACKKAGITDAHPGGAVDIHSLRVTFTTLALDAGANVKAVSEILGHHYLDFTLLVYNKVHDSAKRAAVDLLPYLSESGTDVAQDGTKEIKTPEK